MKKIPKIKLTLTNEKEFDSLKIKSPTVLFFYPKALTGGCSVEVADFQNYLNKFKKIGYEIIGASKDTVERNKKFSEKYKLKYPLGSDEGKNCEKLNIWVEKSMYGKKYFGIDRSTFIIDKNGKILKYWNKVKVKGHAEEVYNYCKDLK
jgi:peroxiredoxin Q/BCP|tara:strand:- start:65 stop:511 length:447 start_codon:yes stop_codon:yes gene_type:complete